MWHAVFSLSRQIQLVCISIPHFTTPSYGTPSRLPIVVAALANEVWMEVVPILGPTVAILYREAWLARQVCHPSLRLQNIGNPSHHQQTFGLSHTFHFGLMAWKTLKITALRHLCTFYGYFIIYTKSGQQTTSGTWTLSK